MKELSLWCGSQICAVKVDVAQREQRRSCAGWYVSKIKFFICLVGKYLKSQGIASQWEPKIVRCKPIAESQRCCGAKVVVWVQRWRFCCSGGGVEDRLAQISPRRWSQNGIKWKWWEAKWTESKGGGEPKWMKVEVLQCRDVGESRWWRLEADQPKLMTGKVLGAVYNYGEKESL